MICLRIDESGYGKDMCIAFLYLIQVIIAHAFRPNMMSSGWGI